MRIESVEILDSGKNSEPYKGRKLNISLKVIRLSLSKSGLYGVCALIDRAKKQAIAVSRCFMRSVLQIQCTNSRL